MDNEIDRLTRTGTVTQEVYRVVREAIKQATEQSGQLYEVGQEAHYQALAAVMALKAAGYSIEKTKTDA